MQQFLRTDGALDIDVKVSDKCVSSFCAVTFIPKPDGNGYRPAHNACGLEWWLSLVESCVMGVQYECTAGLPVAIDDGMLFF